MVLIVVGPGDEDGGRLVIMVLAVAAVELTAGV
jgi:hypothetical protein